MNKLLVITGNVAPYRLRWCEELSKHFEVEIVYTKDHDFERDDRWLQNSSKYCKISKLNNPKDLYDPICFDVIDYIKNNKKSLIIFDGYGPKTNLLGLLYCKINKIETFTNVDGFALGEKTSFVKKVLLKYIVSHLLTNILCSSEVTKKHLIELGAKPKRICAHNFSSVTRDRILDKPLTTSEKQKIREELGIDTNKRIVFGCGAFIPRKRFEDLIVAIKECKVDCELYILGGKPTIDYLDLVGDAKNIHFIDFVPPEFVDEYYKMSDIFVLSSQTDVWGLVLNEAISVGLPVISSDNCVAGLSMIDGNGIVYKTGDIVALKDAIENCLSTKNYDKYALKSLIIAKNYNIESMVERQLPFLNKYFESKI